MNLIFTIELGAKIKEVSHYTLPKMQSYADKVGAGFLVIHDQLDYKYPVLLKFEAARLLEKYDRVLFLDADIVIRDNAPNIFKVVPDDYLGVYLESEHIDERITQCEFFWDKLKLEHEGCPEVFNAGVMLFSQCHKNIIKLPPSSIDIKDFGRFSEQVWLNYIFRDTDVCDITHEYNHMDLSKESDANVFFRHYASADRKKLIQIIKGKSNE